MSVRVWNIWGNAAWREAARLREPFIDVDHLLLGLVAVGGPAHGCSAAADSPWPRAAALR